MSSIDKTFLAPIRPIFHPQASPAEPPSIQHTIKTLALQTHPEGGYFAETDRDPRRVPNPFLTPAQTAKNQNGADTTRAASTTIYYLLTPTVPTGVFHRNKGRTVHTLHRGRGRYVIIHADEAPAGSGAKARIETFVVGHDAQRGERLQWIVEGGKYKASFLLPDREDECKSEGLLISETVVPGFEFRDHDFMPGETLRRLVSAEQAEELRWLLAENR